MILINPMYIVLAYDSIKDYNVCSVEVTFSKFLHLKLFFKIYNKRRF